MNVERFSIEGLLLLTPRVFGDERGWFKETYQAPRYRELGIPDLPQHNVSSSKRGVIRGLHFQREPHAQGKLIQVLRGSVWDVVVDVREGSPTFGSWLAFDLSADNHRQLWVPPGFAHGFQALEDDTVFHYACSALYNPQAEGAFHVFSQKLALPWPLRDGALVNAKDMAAPGFEG
jgi:dTDP-4-dehydrorhamnose 3,5-epimerase